MDIILKKSEGASLTFSAAFNVNATSYTFNAGELKRTLDDNLTMDDANYWKDKVEDHDYPFSQKPGEYAKEICVLTGEGDHGLSVTFKAQALDSYYYVEAKNGDHGTASIASPATDKKYAPESKLNISATPATGYSFNKWTYSVEEGPKASFGSDTSASTTFNVPGFDGYKYLWCNNRNYTVTPSFNPNTYTVAFDKNADDATGSMENQSFTYDTAQNLYENAFEYDGHVFAGWTTNAEGTGTVYADKQSVKNLTAEANATVTLYAQWEEEPAPVKTFSITVVKVEGGVVAASKKKAAKGDPITVSATPKSGYTFDSWDVTDEDGNTIKVKSALAAQAESSSTKTKGATTTTVKQNSALAKTADPTSIAQSLVACGLGTLAFTSGVASRKRRK
ncbi:MAG: InlB B-repeat-containing protein [Atopobiaceae bacterium]|nr:InlB B-repeat-containing protein [Atopobiaceae bacterium]